MTPERVRQVLGPLLGQELTPENCARIEAALVAPTAPIELEDVPVLVDGDIVVRAERFHMILEELHRLHEAHWLETEKFRHGIPMDPDYEAMAERERQGRLLQLTIRKGGVLVGHLRMFINQSLHTRTLYAEEDTLFILPAHRDARTGHLMVKVMRIAEAAVLALGVREIRANSKVVNHADVLMRRLRYPHVASLFCRIFPEDHHEPAS